MTLISSCYAVEVDPTVYLEDVLVRYAAPGSARSVVALVPHRWMQLREAEAGRADAPATA